jgi:hypothetical protein
VRTTKVYMSLFSAILFELDDTTILLLTDLPDPLQLNKIKSDGTPTRYDGLGKAYIILSIKILNLLAIFLDPFRRLKGDGFFITATTVLAPGSKGGTIIHPKVGL